MKLKMLSRIALICVVVPMSSSLFAFNSNVLSSCTSGGNGSAPIWYKVRGGGPRFSVQNVLRNDGILNPVNDALDTYYENPSLHYYGLAWSTNIPSGPNNGSNDIWVEQNPNRISAPMVANLWVDCSKTPNQIVEVDIRIDDSVNWGYTYEQKSNYTTYNGLQRPFETTLLHELGHGSGFGHVSNMMSTMGSDRYSVSTNGDGFIPHLGADLVAGLLSFYGPKLGVSARTDILVTHWEYAGPLAAQPVYSGQQFAALQERDSAGLWVDMASTLINNANGMPEYSVYPGQVVNVPFTYENVGYQPESFDIRFVLSNDNLITGAESVLQQSGSSSTSLTLTAGELDTRYYSLTIPSSLNVGDVLFLGVMVDSDNSLNERSEDNNFAYHVVNVVAAP